MPRVLREVMDMRNRSENETSSPEIEYPLAVELLAGIVLMSLGFAFGGSLLELRAHGYGLRGYGGFAIWMVGLLLAFAPFSQRWMKVEPRSKLDRLLSRRRRIVSALGIATLVIAIASMGIVSPRGIEDARLLGLLLWSLGALMPFWARIWIARRPRRSEKRP